MAYMRRFSPLVPFIVFALMLVAGITAKILLARDCQNNGGIVVGAMTSVQSCANR